MKKIIFITLCISIIQLGYSQENLPDYNIVFNQDKVLVFDIVIDNSDWKLMQEDLESHMPKENTGGPSNGGGPSGNSGPSSGSGPSNGSGPSGNKGPDEMMMPPINFDPIWVSSSVTFEGTRWDNVGIRYKASLDSEKLSFKLDFDKYIEMYSDSEEKRFFGFKEINLNSNSNDESMLRQKSYSDLFREMEIISPETSFCILLIDYGKGKKFQGVYTVEEEMDITSLKHQLRNSTGNLYKPEKESASFRLGTYNDKEIININRDGNSDHSDVLSFYTLLNSNNRIFNISQWRQNLESIFNVDGFIKLMAANSVMQNWNTQGQMNYDYYLYNNPDTGLLEYIQWNIDNPLQDDQRTMHNLSLSRVSIEWPMIKYILNIREYKNRYDKYLIEFSEGAFSPKSVIKRYDSYYKLIKDYAYKESKDAFETGIESLKDQVSDRYDTVQIYFK